MFSFAHLSLLSALAHPNLTTDRPPGHPATPRQPQHAHPGPKPDIATTTLRALYSPGPDGREQRSRVYDRLTWSDRLGVDGDPLVVGTGGGRTASVGNIIGAAHDGASAVFGFTVQEVCMGREDLLVRTFVELADTLVDDFDLIEVTHMIVDRCVELFGAAAAGLMLAKPGGALRVLASSSDQLRIVELFEIHASEGACVDCYRSGSPPGFSGRESDSREDRRRE